MEILLIAKDTTLTLKGNRTIVSTQVSYDTCQFVFDSEWDDYVKTAVFYSTTHAEKIPMLLDTDNKCVIPWESIEKDGALYVGVFGIKDNMQIPTNFVILRLVQGAAGNNAPLPPTMSVYAEIINRINKLNLDLTTGANLAILLNKNISLGNALNTLLKADIATGTPLDVSLKASLVTGPPLDVSLKADIATGTPLDVSLKADIATGTPLDASLKSGITTGNTLDTQLKATIVSVGTTDDELQADIVIAKSTEFAQEITDARLGLPSMMAVLEDTIQQEAFTDEIVEITNDFHPLLAEKFDEIDAGLANKVQQLTFLDQIKLKFIYGALGDSAHDDTINIQNAINDMAIGGILYFPVGEYKITSKLQINKPITLVGCGQYTTRLLAVNCEGIQINKKSYVNIKDIGISLATRYTTTVNNLTGIVTDGDTVNRPFNHVYKNIYIDGFKNAMSVNYLWSSLFDNVKCNNGYVGLSVSGLSVNNVVTACSFECDSTAGSRGIYFVGDVANEGWMINSTLINDCEVGVQGKGTTHVYITNCIIDHCVVSGIVIQDNGTNFGGNWDISGCYIAITGILGDTAIKSTDTVGSSTQNRGNRIRGNDILVYSGGICNYGIYMQGESKHNVIDGNTIKGFAQNDIRTLSVDDIIVNNSCLSAIATNIRGTCNISNNIGTVYYTRATTFSKIGSMKITYDEECPTVGTWSKGDICHNILPLQMGSTGSMYIVIGWIRTTLGSGNVLNTDWREMRALTGN